MRGKENLQPHREENAADIVIVGGGPAGLSAALILGRSRRQVILIDEGKPRNAVTTATHGFLTRDGIAPEEFRNITRQELAKYKSVACMNDIVVDVSKENRLFEAFTQKGSTIKGRKIIFATGIKDHLPPIPGLVDVYGTSVFPCPYCDGWERSDEPLAVIGNSEHLFDYAKLIYNWSKDIAVFTNGPAHLSDEQRSALTWRHILLVEDPIKELKSRGGQLEGIVLNNGNVIARKGGFLMDTGIKQASTLPLKLGVPLDKAGGYETKEHGKTNVDGLYIIGDAETTFSGLIGAAADGYEAGVVINHELVEDDWMQK
jgi:thioredoxin reductase